MKRKSIVLISVGATIAAVIAGVALYTHYRLLATEGEEHGNETAQEIAQEILTGQPAHSGANETKSNSTTVEAGSSHSESGETPEERAAEGH